MNNHIILGAIVSEVRFLTSENGHSFLAFRVQDRTQYNTEHNCYNNFPVLRYGKEKELRELQKSLEIGSAVYVCGEGIYNQKRCYNVIANRIEKIDNLHTEIEIIHTSYYEQFFQDTENIKTSRSETAVVEEEKEERDEES